VATGVLSPGEIAVPLRRIFKRSENVRVVLGEVAGFDLAARRVRLRRLPNGDREREIPYDSLVVAAGSSYSYFGRDEWRPLAPDVKSVESALEVRRRILTAFEAAELETDAERRAAWLTFVVVGAGATGVELAGQIAEIAHDTLRDDFSAIDTRTARILLVEMADRVLPPFPPRLSERAARALDKLGVTPLLGRKVVAVDEQSIVIESEGGHVEAVPARTVVWAAGVVGSELAGALAAESGAELARGGRVAVAPDLTLPGFPDVMAIGDMALVHDAAGNPLPLPGIAPVAMQEGRHAARVIRSRLRGRSAPAFRYRDKGNLATIGRGKAVVDLKGLQISGHVAWLIWLFVHLFYLIGVRNRIVVFLHWTYSFVTRGRGARLVTEQALTPAGEEERTHAAELSR
jgi:NADH dehydrogenase